MTPPAEAVATTLDPEQRPADQTSSATDREERLSTADRMFDAMNVVVDNVSEVVTSVGRSEVRIRPERMRVGLPYGFTLDGVPVVAIKQRDSDTVDFYYIEE